MNGNGFRSAFRMLPFLDSHLPDAAGLLELRGQPPRRLLVWHPEGVGWIFRADRQLHHVPSRTLSPLLGPTSLLWDDGPRHAAYRQLLAPQLRGRALQLCRPIISNTVHTAIEELSAGTQISLVK